MAHIMSPRHLSHLVLLPALAAFTLSPRAQSTATSPEQIALTEPAAVALAESLSSAIDAVAVRVAQCIASKEAPAQFCFCRYPNEVKLLSKQYQAAIAKFPGWHAKQLNWSSPGGKQGKTVSMAGLERQLKQECPK